MTDWLDIDAIEAETAPPCDGPPPHGEAVGCCGHCSARALIIEVRRLRDEQETLNMQVVACGVAALQNSEKSSNRIGRDNPYWSSAYGDVCDTVDREMALRAENKKLRAILSAAWVEV